jgi:oxygen-independent coproporphyrinogen-3 oxidase
MYNKVIDILTKNGFNHYEISNFSKGTNESLHNKAYWLNKEYLGLGSGSHSLLNNNRFANTRNITTYIRQIEAHDYEQYDYYDVNTLSDVLMLNLRLLKGIDIKHIELSYKVSLYKQYPKLKEFIKNGLLEEIDGYLRFTTKGILLGNIVFQIFVEV